MTSALRAVGREGRLRLAFARRGGETRLVDNVSHPPLQVMRAIRDAAGCLCVYLLSPTGGVVQGDRYTLQLSVGANAHALFTTQSATKVYRMPDGCAEQWVRIDVEAGGVFEFVPDATILFADADLRQRLDVRLHPGALALIYEIVMPGRLARGESLQFRRYASRTVVRDDTGLILFESSELRPATDDLSAIGRLEDYPCWGSAYLVGDLDAWGIDADAFCAAQLAGLQRPDALGAVSRLHRNGLVARIVSQRLESIYAAFEGLRAALRTQHLGLAHAPLRK